MDYLMWYPVVPTQFNKDYSYILVFNCWKFYWVKVWWAVEFDTEDCSYVFGKPDEPRD